MHVRMYVHLKLNEKNIIFKNKELFISKYLIFFLVIMYQKNVLMIIYNFTIAYKNGGFKLFSVF